MTHAVRQLIDLGKMVAWAWDNPQISMDAVEMFKFMATMQTERNSGPQQWDSPELGLPAQGC